MTAEIEKEMEFKWVKHGVDAKVAFLGKDVIVISSSYCITFVESSRPDKPDITYYANCEVKGDGVKALCAHRILHCFAFAELCRNPRILVLSYPKFDVFKIFETNTDASYEALRFSEMEFLVALTGLPDFKIVVWNWRSGEKIFSKESNLKAQDQILRMSLTTPIFMIQAQSRESFINLWGIDFCYKHTIIKKKEIKLPESSIPPYYYAFGADSELYFVDGRGSLYSVSPETAVITPHILSDENPRGNFFPCVAWFKGGVVFSTPSEVFFYRRKSPEGWTKIWSFFPTTPFRNILASALKDYIVGITVLNEVYSFKGDEEVELCSVKHFGSNFEFFGFINPLGDYLMTFGNTDKAFSLWNKRNGQKVARLCWSKGLVKDMKTNPRLPYAVAVTEKGSVHIINAYEHTNLLEIDGLLLTDNSLNAIRYRSQGIQFCVANMDVGEFFLLGLPMKLEVVGHLRIDLKIVDFGMVDKESSLLLLIVPMSQLCCRSGHTICIYTLNEKEKTFEYIKDVTLPTIVVQILPSQSSSNHLICIPHRSRKIYFFNFISGNVLQEFVSGHQTKYLAVYMDNQYLLTWGSDGLVIVRAADTKKCVVLFYAHHRLAKGTVNIASDPSTQHVAALGGKGSLVLVYLRVITGPNRRMEHENLMRQYKTLLFTPYFSEKSKHMFKKQTSMASSDESEEIEETPKVVIENKTWLSIRAAEKAILEEQHYRKKKQAVMEEFMSIKTQVKELIDENEANVPEKQLLIQAFDLDKVARRKKFEDGKIDREKERQYQLAKMKCLNNISEVIKKVCADSVSSPAREIHGIIAPLKVQSYSLLPINPAAKTKLMWIEERLKLKKVFLKSDYFDPWIPRTESQMQSLLNQKFEECNTDVTQIIKTKYEEHQVEEEKVKVDSDELKTKFLWSGTSTHNFIEVESEHYTQFEISTYLQSHEEISLIENDIRKLMLWFNKRFEETFKMKEQEVLNIIDKNNRLRHVIQELSFFNFSRKICNTLIYDPKWAPEEEPSTILTVKDSEITVPQYRSESVMELMKKQMEEEGRLRQLLLADDFRERALVTMMDGVLEKLWEDEIKKDVPNPKCMIEKSPEAYTEEDIKAINAYHEAVRFLRTERERYRKILEGNWAKTTLSVKEIAARFDQKLMELHVLKLKVESAIQQEVLKCLRLREECYRRIAIDYKIEELKMAWSKKEEELEEMNAELIKLQENNADCKTYYENLLLRDKNLDKNFKKEFTEYSPVIVEQLYKLSKKRPKLQVRTVCYATLLNDMGKCAVTGAKPEYMPIECIQYLKDIDILDSSANMPASVSAQSWETTCKLRRTKIDNELKIRACTLDLAEAEMSISNYLKSMKSNRDSIVSMQNEVQELKAKKLQINHDKKIQIVLKKGLVEVPLSGQLSDFDECILVTKNTLIEINKEINEVGMKKIKAMQKATNFRKGIIYNEWEHKKLRMEIEDLQSILETVEKFNVLKELQVMLAGRARGFNEEKGFLFMENALSKVKENFEVAQRQTYGKMDELNMKIAKLNYENRGLDERIAEVNVELNELNLSRIQDFDEKHVEENRRRMKKIRQRSSLMRKIQEQHNEILLLQTELELIRLRTYPTLGQKTS